MTEIILEINQDRQEVSEEIEKIIKVAVIDSLKYENCDFDAEVSVTIVDNDEIRSINAETRNIDAVTDVLSFPMCYFDENGDIIESDYDMDGENIVLGDIVISAERAKIQAEEYGHSFKREMAFLTVHSMLHLLGYDHVDDPEGERIMFAKQDEILNLMGITREAK